LQRPANESWPGISPLKGVVMDIHPIGNSTQSAVPRTDGAVTPVAQKAAAQVQTVDAVQQAATVPSLAQVQKAIEDINKSEHIQTQGIEFSIDPDDERTIVRVVDKNTKTVLRQIPSEEALDIAKALDKILEKTQGLLISQKA
jgi:flagellar protein FlaG